MSKLSVYTGKKWVEIAKDGKDAVVDYDYIISQIPTPEKGKDGSPDSGVEIIEKINNTNKVIDAERVRGLVKIIQDVERYGTNPSGVSIGGGKNIRFLASGTEVSAHVTEINFSTGITATYDNEGRITLTADSASISVETPTGTVDGANDTFTVTSAPKWIDTDTGHYYEDFGYTRSGLTITMSLAPNEYIRAVL